MLFFCRSEDRVADLGDYLTLHGFLAGAPGDPATVPVWLGVDALVSSESDVGFVRRASWSSAVTCRPDPDMLDRRDTVPRLERRRDRALPREVAHLKDLATADRLRDRSIPTATGEVGAELRSTTCAASIDAGRWPPVAGHRRPYLAVLEPLLRATTMRLRSRQPRLACRSFSQGRTEKDVTTTTVVQSSVSSGTESTTPAPSWAKLFVSVGDRDGLRAGDLSGRDHGRDRYRWPRASGRQDRHPREPYARSRCTTPLPSRSSRP